jgi:hypothetical protein
MAFSMAISKPVVLGVSDTSDSRLVYIWGAYLYPFVRYDDTF